MRKKRKLKNQKYLFLSLTLICFKQSDEMGRAQDIIIIIIKPYIIYI